MGFDRCRSSACCMRPFANGTKRENSAQRVPGWPCHSAATGLLNWRRSHKHAHYTLYHASTRTASGTTTGLKHVRGNHLAEAGRVLVALLAQGGQLWSQLRTMPRHQQHTGLFKRLAKRANPRWVQQFLSPATSQHVTTQNNSTSGGGVRSTRRHRPWLQLHPSSQRTSASLPSIPARVRHSLLLSSASTTPVQRSTQVSPHVTFGTRSSACAGFTK